MTRLAALRHETIEIGAVNELLSTIEWIPVGSKDTIADKPRDPGVAHAKDHRSILRVQEVRHGKLI
jgi:hypothetical protein